MARHVNIISSQFRNYLFSPLKLRVTKVPTCMFSLILCLPLSTTCLESKLYILQCARSIGVTASETRAQKWMARHVNIISSQFRNYLFSPLKLHVTKVPTCMFFFILCLHLSTTCLESKLYIFSVPDRFVSQRLKTELKNGWRGTSTSFLINSATICPLHSSFISLKYQLACSYSLFACVCVSTTCLESRLCILQCARSIGVTASETRAQKWMARHVNIISSQFRNYLFSPLKLRVTKVPTCMFFFILCLHLSTTCLESKLYILQCA